MLALLALGVATLSACGPATKPEPTPTAAFASEEEAFAAAEEVYRAYNDAVNGQRSEEGTPNPQDYLTSVALENDIDATRLLDEGNVTVVGDGAVKSFEGLSTKLDSTPVQVTAVLCLDVGGTQVVNEEGIDVTPAERVDLVSLAVEFVLVDEVLKIADSNESEDPAC